MQPINTTMKNSPGALNAGFQNKFSNFTLLWTLKNNPGRQWTW